MAKQKNKNEGATTPSSNAKKVDPQEKLWWDALYMYVKNDILEFNPELNLPRYAVLRLKGMAQGRFVAGKENVADITYGYRVVLAAFEKVAPLLKYGLKEKTFANFQHKINWMFTVVEPHLNDAYLLKVEEEKIQEDLAQNIGNVMHNIERYHETNNYTQNSEEFIKAKPWDPKHKDMW